MKKLINPLYALCVILFAIFSYFFVDVNLFQLKTVYTGLYLKNMGFVTVLYVLFLVIFYIFYIGFLKLILSESIKLRDLVKVLLLSLILSLSYPAIISYDIFNYLATAKVTYFYKENPYIIMPIEFPQDLMLMYTRAVNKIALYGPTWILLSAIPFYLGSSNFLLTLFLFKAFVILFYFGIIYALYKLSNKSIFAVAFFALNPLVLIETFVSGHNDVVMIFFSILAFYYLKEKKIFSGSVFLVLSIFVKFATLFLLPLYIYVSILTIKKIRIDWQKVWAVSAVSMLTGFLLSPIREEMYPWYAIWFISYVALLKSRIVQIATIILSFGLMLRYTPFMATGTYHGDTPMIRIIVTIVPLVVFLIFLIGKNFLKQK